MLKDSSKSKASSLKPLIAIEGIATTPDGYKTAQVIASDGARFKLCRYVL